MSPAALTGLGAAFITLAVVACIIGCFTGGLMFRSFMTGDRYATFSDEKIQKGRKGIYASFVVCCLLAVGGIAAGSYAITRAGFERDTSIPNRLNRNQVDVNVNGTDKTGVIVGAGG